MIDVFVKCVPPKSTAQASLRIMKRKDGSQFVGKFANSKGKAVQNNLLTLFAPHAPAAAYSNAIKVSVTWTYPWRASETKKNKAKGRLPCTTRPDADNLCKLFFDVLTSLNYWSDDSIIAELVFQKFWGECPGIGLRIEEIDEEEDPF